MKTLAHARDKAEIVCRLRMLRPESLRRWGRMSAHQAVCHLTDSFRMVLGHKPVSHTSTLLRRTLVKWVALYAPVRWPTGVRTTREIDQELGGTTPVEFAADLARLETLLETFTVETRMLDGQLHPTLGRMSRIDWLRWGYLHMDHHLRQFDA
jgi:Protein of unknown function (DUF1569)